MYFNHPSLASATDGLQAKMKGKKFAYLVGLGFGLGSRVGVRD